MKGTKLWIDTRSPLIRGRSRRERPFSRDLVTGAAAACAIGAVLAVVLVGDKGVTPLLSLANLVVWTVAGATSGSALGVWLARGFGWHPRWLAGGVVGTVLGVVAVVAIWSTAVHPGGS